MLVLEGFQVACFDVRREALTTMCAELIQEASREERADWNTRIAQFPVDVRG